MSLQAAFKAGKMAEGYAPQCMDREEIRPKAGLELGIDSALTGALGGVSPAQIMSPDVS